MKNIRIGVLGGIGPEATGEFYNRLIKKLQTKRLINNNSDFPQIIINSIPAQEIIYGSISENNLNQYITGLKELDSFNVDLIVVVCNTFYSFYDKLQKEIKTPIINLNKDVKKVVLKLNIKKIGVIATPTTTKTYNFKNMKCIFPSNTELKIISETIFKFNIGSKNNQKAKIKKIINSLIKKGSQKVIIGCTEISLMFNNNEELPIIDTFNILVDSTINNYLSLIKEK